MAGFRVGELGHDHQQLRVRPDHVVGGELGETQPEPGERDLDLVAQEGGGDEIGGVVHLHAVRAVELIEQASQRRGVLRIRVLGQVREAIVVVVHAEQRRCDGDRSRGSGASTNRPAPPEPRTGQSWRPGRPLVRRGPRRSLRYAADVEPVEDPGTAGSYPSSWEADVVLRDGHTIRVRPIVPDDGDRLLRFHDRQSAESVYYRYFSPRPRLSQRDVRHLTHVDHMDRVAFVALSGDEMIGVARYERYRGTDTAEVAFFVDDAHHGRGLATLLLEYLAAAAQERQLRRFSATTLPSNRRMLGVFAAAGYDVASRLDEGVVEVSFDIDPTGDSLAAMDRRERAAESASVRPMLAPASVAVVGAGRRTGTLGADVVANLVANGFVGSLAAVNRNVGTAGGALHGVATVGSVEQLPEGLDLVVIATPAHEVPDVVDACGARGARSVVVLSAGFAESGPRGAELERDALEAARRHGMRLLGPNCLGLINTDAAVRLNATLAPELPPPGRIGMLAEAGILSASILEHARRTGLGLSTMVAAGNRADVSATDLLSYWIDDEATDAVLLYLAARNLQPRFVRAARAASLRLPVAALHTSMATPADARRGSPDADRRAAAMFRQTGVMSVASLGQLFDLGRLLSDQPVPAGPGVAVIGNSDGAIALAADACVGAGLDLVEMEVYSEAGRVLRNPVDLTHRADAEAFADAIAAVTSDERVHSVVVVATPPRLDWDAELADVVLDASERSPSVTFTATLLGAADRTRVSREGVTGRGDVAVPIFPFPEDAARALGSVADYRRWLVSVDPGAEMATGVRFEQAAACDTRSSMLPVTADAPPARSSASSSSGSRTSCSTPTGSR